MIRPDALMGGGGGLIQKASYDHLAVGFLHTPAKSPASHCRASDTRSAISSCACQFLIRIECKIQTPLPPPLLSDRWGCSLQVSVGTSFSGVNGASFPAPAALGAGCV